MTETDKPTLVVFIFIIVSQIVLIFLKITNVINCSWLWVFAPLWIPYLIFLIGGLILAIYFVTSDIIERIFKKHG